jgi:hypothetical protein
VKKLSALVICAVLALSPSVAPACPVAPPPAPPCPAPCPPPNPLADVAHDLSIATGQLSEILSAHGPDDHVYEDALTLYDAAEHFEEEVLLGPEDLDVDFAAIEHTFNEMRAEFRNAPCIQQNPAARSAWFQISEANLRLRIAWFSH